MDKICIIDDDPDIIEVISILLKSKGYAIVSANNVEEALRVVNQEKPSLIILDVMMEEPDDGFYLANKFRKNGVTLPIIMLTSVGKITSFEYSNNEMLPIQEFLEKPVKPAVLLDKIELHLKQSQGN